MFHLLLEFLKVKIFDIYLLIRKHLENETLSHIPVLTFTCFQTMKDA
jgi:hypothetical protein